MVWEVFIVAELFFENFVLVTRLKLQNSLNIITVFCNIIIAEFILNGTIYHKHKYKSHKYNFLQYINKTSKQKEPARIKYSVCHMEDYYI